MKLALSGFLFEDNYVSQSVGFDQFCALARSAGYAGVELRDTQIKPDSTASQKREIMRLIRLEGLAVTCLTARKIPVSGPERDVFFLKYLELCRELQCGLLKIISDTAWLRQAAEQARAYGVILATNNHLGTCLETLTGTRQYFAEIQHSNFGLLFDALHLSVTGQDYLGFIPECLSLTRNILIHSLRPARPGDSVLLEHNGRKWTRALPDDADVLQKWPDVLRAFKTAGYDGLITVIENGWPNEQRDHVARHCAEVIRRLWQ